MNPATARTFRELDEALGRPKGSAFRAFKQSLPQLLENNDFILLDADTDRLFIEELRCQGRIYPLSRNVVLLSQQTFEKLAELLAEQSA